MKDELMEMFSINETCDFEFGEVCGFTFAFKTRIWTMKDQLTSASITPIGIIYEENDEYYMAPLDETIDIEEVIEEFVKRCLLR